MEHLGRVAVNAQSKIKANARLRGLCVCLPGQRKLRGGSPDTRGNLAAKSLWELSIGPKSDDLGEITVFNMCGWPCGEHSWCAETAHSMPMPMNRVH